MKFNIYGEVINIDDYQKLEDLFNKEELNDEERDMMKNKTRCACGLILSIYGIKAHVSSSKIHKKRMSALGFTEAYCHPRRPYSRLQKKIEIQKEKITISFD